MIRDILISILNSALNEIIIIGSILFLFRLCYLKIKKKKFILFKELLILSFMTYCICLYETVTFPDVSWSTSNIIPFKEILRYDLFSNMFIRNVIGNILMFIPFGFFLGYFLKIKKYVYLFLLILGISLTIETTQLVIGRVFDIDDIFLNLIGGILGFLIYRFIVKIGFLKNRLLCNTVTVLILTLFFVYLFVDFGV